MVQALAQELISLAKRNVAHRSDSWEQNKYPELHSFLRD